MSQATSVWISVRSELPPEGVEVETQSHGRTVQTLRRKGRLWFFPDWSAYVYYTPTHWRRKQAKADTYKEVN